MRSHRVSVLMVEEVSVTCVEEVSTRVNAFVMRYVSIERRDVQSDKNGVVGLLSELLEFVKEVCSVFYEGLCSLYQRFEVIVYKL